MEKSCDHKKKEEKPNTKKYKNKIIIIKKHNNTKNKSKENPKQRKWRIYTVEKRSNSYSSKGRYMHVLLWSLFPSKTNILSGKFMKKYFKTVVSLIFPLML